jgi:hypothetical protein
VSVLEICIELTLLGAKGWCRPERARLAPESGEPKVEPGGEKEQWSLAASHETTPKKALVLWRLPPVGTDDAI